MKRAKINFMEKFSQLPDEDYSVRIIAMMNNYEFKIVKFKGEFIWHSHSDTDETFIILDGKMLMNFRDKVKGDRIKSRGDDCSPEGSGAQTSIRKGLQSASNRT